MNKTVITTGDPNGIGAEITVKTLRCSDVKGNVILVSNRRILDFYGGGDLDCELIEIPFDEDIQPGRVTAGCGEFSFQSLKKACEAGLPIVTAPVSKAALHLAGRKFNGQTEILEYFLAHDGQRADMLFTAEGLRVLLLTRHVPLKEVSLTKEIVVEKISNLAAFLASPAKFALCGFNPHAGEGGILGREETEILIPAVEALRAKGIDITMPLPADTLFSQRDKYDCIVANYHDQGLIPIKTLYGRRVVNMTIGLDVIRTSPPHGTAFDIAGKNLADPAGMIEAVKKVIGAT
ncbi:MAG: 4-hydroxythreonine-4-phosphate dehydrogenase PdxA [Heliobacteriaceae bacterium]|jgi:4-hydroxythreonine-4-phosphate dehydrogenase|nr:4-hydroxythreonine-4-phosphate dehydrogenase PdxA [Heliobacteriaceae bacterium]